WTGGVFNNSSFTASSSQTYTVTGTDAAGCTNVSSVSITVNPLPTVSPSSPDGPYCENAGNSPLLFANNTMGSTASWSPGPLTGNSVNVSPNITTTYTVTATDANNCVSNPGYITVTVFPLPIVT